MAFQAIRFPCANGVAIVISFEQTLRNPTAQASGLGVMVAQITGGLGRDPGERTFPANRILLERVNLLTGYPVGFSRLPAWVIQSIQEIGVVFAGEGQ